MLNSCGICLIHRKTSQAYKTPVMCMAVYTLALQQGGAHFKKWPAVHDVTLLYLLKTAAPSSLTSWLAAESN